MIRECEWLTLSSFNRTEAAQESAHQLNKSDWRRQTRCISPKECLLLGPSPSPIEATLDRGCKPRRVESPTLPHKLESLPLGFNATQAANDGEQRYIESDPLRGLDRSEDICRGNAFIIFSSTASSPDSAPNAIE